jgi:hypothetical protein
MMTRAHLGNVQHKAHESLRKTMARVHYKLRHKVAGSKPKEENDFFFNLPNPSGRSTPWDLLSL